MLHYYLDQFHMSWDISSLSGRHLEFFDVPIKNYIILNGFENPVVLSKLLTFACDVCFIKSLEQNNEIWMGLTIFSSHHLPFCRHFEIGSLIIIVTKYKIWFGTDYRWKTHTKRLLYSKDKIISTLFMAIFAISRTILYFCRHIVLKELQLDMRNFRIPNT